MAVGAKPDVVLPEFLPFLMMSDRFMNRAGEIDRVAIALEPSVKEIVFTRKPAREEKASSQN